MKQSVVIAMEHTKLYIAEKGCILALANERLGNTDIAMHTGRSMYVHMTQTDNIGFWSQHFLLRLFYTEGLMPCQGNCYKRMLAALQSKKIRKIRDNLGSGWMGPGIIWKIVPK